LDISIQLVREKNGSMNRLPGRKDSKNSLVDRGMGKKGMASLKIVLGRF